MDETWKRTENLLEVIEGVFMAPTVHAKWIPDSNLFWYRRQTKLTESSFWLVDVDRRISKPAFDHEKLVAKLKKKGIEAHPTALPFEMINVSSDGERITFSAGGINWQYTKAGHLDKYNGEIDDGILQPLQEERPSSTSKTTRSAITFVNQSNTPVEIWWVDYAGQARLASVLPPGKIEDKPTYNGHVWRVHSTDTKEVLGIYAATYGKAKAIIEQKAQNVTNKPDDITSEKDPQAPKKALPGRELKLIVKDHNIWVRDGAYHESQITDDATSENSFNQKFIFLSPDGKFAVAWQCTTEQPRAVHVIESSPVDQLHPILRRYQALKPGDNIRIERPRLFDLHMKKEIYTADDAFDNPFVLASMGWAHDSSEYWFIYNERGHQLLRLIGLGTSGGVRILIEERAKTFIDYSQKMFAYRIRHTDELIWASERSGRNHLYLYDLSSGALKNQITTGDWLVRSIERIDRKKRQLWFTAYGIRQDQDPYYAHLVRVHFDGGGIKVLTEGDGTHTWTWSPDGKYIIDTCSRVDLAPQVVLRDADAGTTLLVLETPNLTPLLDIGWSAPERFCAPGRDGKTIIYGIIIKPFGFDPRKKYPVIDDIYSGPHTFHVQKSFSPMSKHRELANLGFIVVQIDGMGTNWRHKQFHDVCYKNLRDAGLPDHLVWLRAAAETRPWMDLSDGVGIYGSSAGGHNAMSAMLWHGHFFKAAVADSGCHDSRLDKLWWSEAYMGWPIDQAYEDSSNVEHAGQLTGALMLILGELDYNVDPSSTMQLIWALNEAGKDYDFVYMPGCGHGVGSTSRYALRRQQDFFMRHLLHIEPPDRNA